MTEITREQLEIETIYIYIIIIKEKQRGNFFSSKQRRYDVYLEELDADYGEHEL